MGIYNYEMLAGIVRRFRATAVSRFWETLVFVHARLFLVTAGPSLW